MQKVEKIKKRRKRSEAPGSQMYGIELRQGGVYLLPDGRELVVGIGREGRYFLYHPLLWEGQTWIINLPIAYEIDAQGWVITGKGQPTAWRIEDLGDTGRTLKRN